MLTECAPQGSLDHVLNQAAADDVDVSMPVRIAMFLQVADAMVHLDLYKVIHRDLASRTVLAFGLDALDWKAVHIKVTDYGLSLLIDNGFTNAGKSVCRSLHAPCVCSGADAVDGSGVARAPGVLEQEPLDSMRSSTFGSQWTFACGRPQARVPMTATSTWFRR